MIDTDTRQLRRATNGMFTAGAGKVPCDHCGETATCAIKLSRPIVHACDVFLPAIPFTDDTGLGHISNTIRVGMAWTQRLEVGQRVALYDTKAKQIFGHSTVLFTEWGPIADMLKRHAHANHIMLDTPRAAAGVKLLNWLRQNYGPRIINNDTRLTAIYLLREHGPPAAADRERHEADGQAQGDAASPGQDHGDAGGRPADDR